MRKVLFIMCSLSLLIVFGISANSFAEFPDKPITYTISFNPGGESDITARLQEPHLEKILGVPINVTHKPGGGGGVAWSAFQRSAKPTGYEIIGVNIPHIIGQPRIRKDAGYKTFGFEFITWFHFTPNALIVQNDSPFKTLKDFIDFAKKNPKVITVGGSGTYSANHLGALQLEKAAGIKLTYIPHKGTGPLKPAILGGHLTALMNYTMLPVELKDNVRVLAVAAEKRAPALPDAPTFREQGYDIIGGAFRGVAAPKGTPKAIVKKLTDAFVEVNNIIKAKQEPMGFVLTNYTGDEAITVVKQMEDGLSSILNEIAAKKK